MTASIIHTHDFTTGDFVEPLHTPRRHMTPMRGAPVPGRPLLSERSKSPRRYHSHDEQHVHAYEYISSRPDSLTKFITLSTLQGLNPVLYYQIVTEHLEEMLPIIGSPTIGLACQRYSTHVRTSVGLSIKLEDQGRIHERLAAIASNEVRIVVVTDNERILGIGDQGAGGVLVPVSKATLYTAIAGIYPAHCLPVSLDVGTDNRALIDDPRYLGCRRPRLRGPQYDELIEEFVVAVQNRFPQALIHWEDFKSDNALRVLSRYGDRVCSFNGDVQGTAAVVLAGLISAATITGLPASCHRILIAGAGAAGIGIARQLAFFFQREGVSDHDIRRSIALVDRRGLIGEDRMGDDPLRAPFAWSSEMLKEAGLQSGRAYDLCAIVQALRPTMLVGVSGQVGLFDEATVRAMAGGVARPVIFALSNPPGCCEARAVDLYEWTAGRAIVGVGSPCPAVVACGRTFRPTYVNNLFVFPGVGLGMLLARAKVGNDRMFDAAARSIADQAMPGAEELFPALTDLRGTAWGVGKAVAAAAEEDQKCMRPLPVTW